jgi:hypothetical protein
MNSPNSTARGDGTLLLHMQASIFLPLGLTFMARSRRYKRVSAAITLKMHPINTALCETADSSPFMDAQGNETPSDDGEIAFESAA